MPASSSFMYKFQSITFHPMYFFINIIIYIDIVNIHYKKNNNIVKGNQVHYTQKLSLIIHLKYSFMLVLYKIFVLHRKKKCIIIHFYCTHTQQTCMSENVFRLKKKRTVREVHNFNDF